MEGKIVRGEWMWEGGVQKEGDRGGWRYEVGREREGEIYRADMEIEV